MSNLEELAAAAKSETPRQGLSYRGRVERQGSAPGRFGEWFKAGFFYALGAICALVFCWIAVAALAFLLSFVGCAIIAGGAASSPPQTPWRLPLGK